MRKLLSVVLLFLVIASVSSAQKAANAKQSFSKYEVYLGYDFERSFGDLNQFSSNTFAPFNSHGGQLSAAYFPLKHVGIKSDFAYSRKLAAVPGTTDLQEVNISRSYVIGPVLRFDVPHVLNGRVSVFAQQLFGANQYSLNFDYKGTPDGCSSNNQACRAAGFTSVSGAGVNLRINRYLSIRPAELDYWNHQINASHFLGTTSSSLQNAGISTNGFRYSAGTSVNF